MSLVRPLASDPRKSTVSFILFLFKRLRTLFCNRAITTPFLSTTSAPFPIQRREEQQHASPMPTTIFKTYKLLPIFTPLQLSLFSCTYKPPNLQAFCFDNVATVGGGAGVNFNKCSTTSPRNEGQPLLLGGLRELPPEAALDAQVPLRHGVVERRTHFHNLAFLRV